MATATASGGSGASKKKVAPKIKVSKDTISTIKSLGMAKTLKMIPDYNNKAVRNMPGNAEFVEGARRMYGDRRIAAAMAPKKAAAPKKKTTPTAPRYTSPDNARAGKTAPKYKSADSARRSSMK